jgi:hypothetical protein
MPFRLTTVATFRTPTSAWVARNYLAEKGIRAFVFDDNISTSIWTWGNAIGWTKLQVETEFEHAAYQALRRWREARDLLHSECQNVPAALVEGRPSPAPCRDRKPVTSAERWQPTPNPREDLVRRAKIAAVYALILSGNAAGLPRRWERISGIPELFVELFAIGLLGFSTWLLWTSSTTEGTLSSAYQRDLYWGKCINAIMYSMLVIMFFYVVSFSQS